MARWGLPPSPVRPVRRALIAAVLVAILGLIWVGVTIAKAI